MPRQLLAALLFVPALAPQLLGQQAALPSDRAEGAAAVTEADAKEWLYKLASEEFAGRGTGQPGFQLAADYVAAHFEKLGLQPAGDDGTFFQKVPWGSARIDEAASSLTFRVGDQALAIPVQRLGGQASTDTRASGEVVLITDFAAIEGAELTGKVVVLFGGDRRARFMALGALSGKAAAATMYASEAAPTRTLSGSSGARGGNRALRGRGLMPATVEFGGEDLTALLAMCGKRDALATKGVVPLGATADLVLSLDESDAPACNVVGVLPGSDPARKDEYVVIGSHLDHLGERRGQIYPGADDDGSGTTGVMAVAQMFANNPVRPTRSVLFVCFCGEENGLVGSRYFVGNSPIPLTSIVGELQMDMIGRDEEEGNDGPRRVNIGETAADNKNSLHLVGTQKLSPMMHELCVQKNEAAGFDLEYDQESLFSRSDHANFGRMGVPIAFFFTGIHEDYHQVTDTPDKINYPKLLRISRYVYDIAFELAQMQDRPRIDPELWAKYPRPGSAEPAAPMMDKAR